MVAEEVAAVCVVDDAAEVTVDVLTPSTTGVDVDTEGVVVAIDGVEDAGPAQVSPPPAGGVVAAIGLENFCILLSQCFPDAAVIA